MNSDHLNTNCFIEKKLFNLDKYIDTFWSIIFVIWFAGAAQSIVSEAL